MENGTTVILLNLENLYESLYDALNQVVFMFTMLKTFKMEHIMIKLKRIACSVLSCIQLSKYNRFHESLNESNYDSNRTSKAYFKRGKQ